MKLYSLQRTQILSIDIKQAWDFFSNPKNLRTITPPWLGFKITSEVPEKIYPGLLITYQVTPVLGIPMDWVTEISQVQEPHFFIDEQRLGPYQFWHHQHVFKETANGLEVRDIVNYSLPLGILGQFAHSLFVSEQLKEIFDFRYKVLEQKFGKATA